MMDDSQNFELIDARLERVALWQACWRNQIPYETLLERMEQLRKRWGDALYARPSRRG